MRGDVEGVLVMIVYRMGVKEIILLVKGNKDEK
jgi:hypothetical protein